MGVIAFISLLDIVGLALVACALVKFRRFCDDSECFPIGVGCFSIGSECVRCVRREPDDMVSHVLCASAL